MGVGFDLTGRAMSWHLGFVAVPAATVDAPLPAELPAGRRPRVGAS